MGDDKTKYPVGNHAEWREKVRRYICAGYRSRAGDRGEEPVYVGRDHIFHLVGEMVAAACEGQTDSRTVVVSGAPGAGKTAFVREVAKRWNDGARPGVAVWLRPGAMNALRLFRELSDVLAVPVAERADYYRAKEFAGDVGLVKGKLSETNAKVSPGDADRIRESDEVPWSLIEKRFGEHLNHENPLLLLCDEAQNMNANSEALRTFLDSLHSGDAGRSAIPLVPVFTGLSDTTEKIVECGITRPTAGNKVTLGALSRAEAEAYALKTLVHLEADAMQNERARWAEWFVADCGGWPQHIRTQMTAVAEAMLEADTSRLRDLDAQAISDRASAFRNEYYRGRLVATGYNACRSLVGEIVQVAGRDGVEEEHLIARALALARAYNERTEMEVSGRDIVAQSIHAGVFQATDAGLYACPIPSMREYLVSGEDHVVPLPPAGLPGLGR